MSLRAIISLPFLFPVYELMMDAQLRRTLKTRPSVGLIAAPFLLLPDKNISREIGRDRGEIFFFFFFSSEPTAMIRVI